MVTAQATPSPAHSYSVRFPQNNNGISVYMVYRILRSAFCAENGHFNTPLLCPHGFLNIKTPVPYAIVYILPTALFAGVHIHLILKNHATIPTISLYNMNAILGPVNPIGFRAKFCTKVQYFSRIQ